MRGVHVLQVLLLLCKLGTSVRCSEDTASYAQDLWSELKDLRVLVSMQNAALTITRTDLQDVKSTVAELKTERAVMAYRLASVEGQLEAKKTENTDLLSKLTSAQGDIERLQKENTEKPKVAFSTSLGMTGSHGPFNTVTTVVYKHIFSNVGNHYNKNTGVFTAPLKGLYHFTFTIGDFLSSTVMGLTLFKNVEAIIHSGEWGDHKQFRYASNGVIIPLEMGDVVFMQLPANYRIHDDSNHRNTFNGMLLYTL